MPLSITNSTYKGYVVTLYELDSGKDSYYQYEISHGNTKFSSAPGKRYWDKRECIQQIISLIEEDISKGLMLGSDSAAGSSH